MNPAAGQIILVTKDKRKFTGKEFVTWVKQFPDKVKTDEEAVKAGQSLLDNRVAHHVTDDAEFEPTDHHVYAFITQESFEVKAAHAAQNQLIAHPEL